MTTRTRAPVAVPAWDRWIPWTDKKGRPDALRIVTFAALLLPALSVALRLGFGLMGARPVNAAIHATGYWAVIFLVASLCVTPAKAIFGLPQFVPLRRMIGNAALFYAALHLVLYAADQNWHLFTVVREIVLRFYLTIGFVALVGLGILGATSTDAAVRRLGAGWKRLHKLAYGITALALIHFILQTKADVSLPLLFVGIFAWLMLWRQLPAGPDRTPWGLLALALGAAIATLAAEWLWYRFGTHIDPTKVILAETQVDFGLGPSDQVALGGVLVLLGLYVRRWSQGPVGGRALFWIVLFALGAAINELVVFAFGIDRFLDPGDYTFLIGDLAWAALLAALGYVHWRLRDAGTLAPDGLALCCIAFQITLSAGAWHGGEIAFAAAIAALWALLAWQAWPKTKLAALALLPLAALLVSGLVTQT